MARNEDRTGVGSAADALTQLFAGPLGKGLAPAAKAARAWYAANGDRERRHTTGVWLRKPGRTGADPVLVVALDSNLMASELGTNKDIYLARLAFHGVAVSDIKFTVRRHPDAARAIGKPSHWPAARANGKASQWHGQGRASGELPELSDGERQRVERATQDLPDGLKQSVSRAMCASLRRSKGSHTQNP